MSAGEMMGLEAPKWDTEMTHLCAVRARAWEADAWMMSFGGLCSAWSVSHWLHLDSPLEEFNLHHTPRRPTLLFLSKCFHRHHPVRNPPLHSSSRTDSSGESDGCALSFPKAKYDFQFFFPPKYRLYIVGALRKCGEETQCQNYLPSGELILTQSVNADRVIPPPSLSESAYHACVREMHHHNWTWNAISLLATKVQVDWGLSSQILISCVGGRWTLSIVTLWHYVKSCFLTAGVCAARVVNDR